MEHVFSFPARLWEAAATNAWVFVTVPDHVADEIEAMGRPAVGFGSVRVGVRIGDTEWKTSLFPDTKVESYVLPIKRAVREQNGLSVGDTTVLTVTVLVE